jgi:conjugative relaxase-like TrwC/TraI family protein
VTVSMRVISAGNGYRYLLRTVAAGDGNRSLATPLTRYYAEAGTPPGRWMGSAVHLLGAGQLTPGAQVTEAQLALLIGLGRDPVTGDALGRAYPQYQPVADRISERTAALDPSLGDEERTAEILRIEAEETAAGSRRAVAGYDFTFSVPKSVSVLWGVADADTQAMIVEAHHAAVTEVLDYLEREVAATRTGVANHNGAVAQVGVPGIVATAYDHWDSRTGDPQLHTHVVISNKVQTLLDGRWRSLDGRPMHAAVTAISAHYNAVLADRLTGTFGLKWEQRDRGEDRNAQWEIEGVNERLIREFSGRTHAIEEEKERLIAEYVERHGRRPSELTIIQLRAQATLTTRPKKQIRSLADLSAEWRARASRLIGVDATAWARSIAAAGPVTAMRPDEIGIDVIRAIGAHVVSHVGEKRSTWRHWNLWAEASRQTMGWRFASVHEREGVVAMIVDAAEHASIALTPPELAMSPADFRREDGTSVFRPRHSTIYSSAETLAAEDRLLERASDRTAATVPAALMETVARKGNEQQRLSDQQLSALDSIATSGRRVDLLVGAAGAGKTTAMRALRSAWTSEHGAGSVVGLAPSAAAAQVLAGELGISCDNTAKWLFEYHRGNATLRRRQLVIVDEASLAGTATLDRLTAIAAEAGAKVLLVGDWAQLQSVDAGGAFALLARTRPDTPELTEIHRFTHAWERSASLNLRDGQEEAIGAYERNDRLRAGTTEEMIDSAYAAGRTDSRAGMETVLVTESTESVHSLNSRARAERILSGETGAGCEVELADGARASAGDIVITRRNDRTLRSLKGGWVRNGDRWSVIDARKDGSLVVRRLDRRLATTVLLPPDYVAEHVDLGYAVTAHRAQGVTVDTAHVVVSRSTTRENLYVSMTRGRESNIAYVALDKPDDTHAAPESDEITARTVLYGVLQHSGVELSAHQTIESEQETWSSIAHLAAEYETLAAAAQQDRFVDLLRSSGLNPRQFDDATSSSAFGPLTAALRLAEAYHYDLAKLLKWAVVAHPLDDAEDVAAVLLYRLETHTGTSPRARRSQPPRLIAGLIPEAVGPMDNEHRRALDQRKELIERRARAIAEFAVEAHAPWTRHLEAEPADREQRDLWLAAASIVAAYRDRHTVTSPQPLGGPARTDSQRRERIRAGQAARRAQRIASEAKARDALTALTDPLAIG